jgi:hypothetical protein
MDGITQALNSLLGKFNGWASYFLTVTALGTITMAVLQAIKDITPIRRWFQRFRMRAWLVSQARLALDEPEEQNSHNETKNDQSISLATSLADDAEYELLLLATNGDACAFYDLEIEKLCGQWNAAIQIVIDFPSCFKNLFACMAARARKEDRGQLLRPDLPIQLHPASESAQDVETQAERMNRRQTFLDARNRVMHQIQRAVDSFQIATAFRWKWHFQVASFLISFGLAVAAETISSSDNYKVALVSAAMAGFLAPIARDLLAAVQKLRA